jgi:predicted transcriptional regulator
MAENNSEGAPNFIELAGDITIAWLQNPNVNPVAEDVPAFLKSMHLAIVGLGEAPAVEPEPQVVAYEPAVPVRSSIKPDYLVSLIDGRKYKTLKRHLATNGLTPDAYRARYGLKSDYPMVAANFAAMRREIAEKIGLGRRNALRPDDIDGTVAAPAEAQEAALLATDGHAALVTSSLTTKSTARKSKARTDKALVASTIASPPVAEAKPVAKTERKLARTIRKVKEEGAQPVDVAVSAKPVKSVASRRRRMAREPEVPTSGTETPDAPAADPIPDGASGRKRGAVKAKAEVEATGSKVVKLTKVKVAATKTVKAKAADLKPAVMLKSVSASTNSNKAKKSAAKTGASVAQEA